MNAREFYKLQCEKQTDAESFNTQKQKFSLYDLLIFAEMYYIHILEERLIELQSKRDEENK